MAPLPRPSRPGSSRESSSTLASRASSSLQPAEERGVGHVDHVFLDKDGIPTLVEVKRSGDTRIRRQVERGRIRMVFVATEPG